MQYEIQQQEKFRFIEVGEGEPLVLLHGLFGALSNFADLIEYFRPHYKVVVPILPLFDLDLLHTTVGDWKNAFIVLLKAEIIKGFIFWEIPWVAMLRWYMCSNIRKELNQSYSQAVPVYLKVRWAIHIPNAEVMNT